MRAILVAILVIGGCVYLGASRCSVETSVNRVEAQIAEATR